MSAEPALVDTNVLVYARYQDADQHADSQKLLDRAQNGDVALCKTAQNVAEFYATVTNPRQPAEALGAIDQMLAMPGLYIVGLVRSQTSFSNEMRYTIPVLPFLFIWISKVARACAFRDWMVVGITLCGIAWASASSMWYYPHRLSGGLQSQSQSAGGCFSKKTSAGVRKPRHARGRLLSSFSTCRTS